MRIHSQADLLRERKVLLLFQLLVELLRVAPFGGSVLLAVTGIAPASVIEKYAESIHPQEDQYALDTVFAPNDVKRRPDRLRQPLHYVYNASAQARGREQSEPHHRYQQSDGIHPSLLLFIVHIRISARDAVPEAAL